MNTFRKIPVLFFAAWLAGCAAGQSLLKPAPSLLPGVNRNMNTAGFWIGRHPCPDRVMLNEAQIQAFHAGLINQGLLTDMNSFPPNVDGRDLAREIENLYNNFAEKIFYSVHGSAVNRKFLKKIRRDLNLSVISKTITAEDAPGMPGVSEAVPARGSMPRAGGAPKGRPLTVRWGMVIHYANERLLPTDEVLTAKPGDIDFDELQNNALETGTWLAVLHESRDQQWLYCRSRSSSGWVRKDFVGFCPYEKIRDWESRQSFAVTLSPKTDIFLDPEMTLHNDHVQMGTRLPLVEQKAQVIEILLPDRDPNGNLVFKEGFVQARDVNIGYLKYTPRNILEQCFKLLNVPYGWGGMYGEQDCSRFLQEVFDTAGIHLPRNSAQQIQAGQRISEFQESAKPEEKLKVLETKSLGGVSLLYMKGHIMLFLGLVGQEPYAIHATWGFRKSEKNAETVYVINKVVVSNLRLGQGSKKGSLLSRLKIVSDVSLPLEEEKF